MKYALRNGTRWEETSFQDQFLEKLYGGLAGRMLVKVIVCPRLFFQIGGMAFRYPFVPLYDSGLCRKDTGFLPPSGKNEHYFV